MLSISLERSEDWNIVNVKLEEYDENIESARRKEDERLAAEKAQAEDARRDSRLWKRAKDALPLLRDKKSSDRCSIDAVSVSPRKARSTVKLVVEVVVVC